MEDYESHRFSASARKQMRDQLRAMRIYFLSPIVLETMGIVAVAGLLIYAQRSIRLGEMSLGDFAGFVFCMFKTYDPIRRLSRLQHDLQQGLTSAARIFRVMDEQMEMRDKPSAALLLRCQCKSRNPVSGDNNMCLPPALRPSPFHPIPASSLLLER